MIEVDRYDKQEDPRTAELQKDWRAWVKENDYQQSKQVSVEVSGINYKTILELWEKEDEHLLYMPPITIGEGKIYILDPGRVEGMIEEVIKLVQVAAIFIQAKRESRQQTYKSMQN